MFRTLPKITETKAERAVSERNASFRSFRDIVRDIWDILFWLGGLSALFSVLMLIKAVNPDRYRAIMQGSKKNMMLVALVFITLIFFVMTRYTLLSPTNVSNIINQNAYIIILACGMLLCIVCSANIDLSVGRVMGFIGACAAKFMIEGKMPVYLAVPLCLGIGILIGMCLYRVLSRRRTSC